MDISNKNLSNATRSYLSKEPDACHAVNVKNVSLQESQNLFRDDIQMSPINFQAQSDSSNMGEPSNYNPNDSTSFQIQSYAEDLMDYGFSISAPSNSINCRQNASVSWKNLSESSLFHIKNNDCLNQSSRKTTMATLTSCDVSSFSKNICKPVYNFTTETSYKMPESMNSKSTKTIEKGVFDATPFQNVNNLFSLQSDVLMVSQSNSSDSAFDENLHDPEVMPINRIKNNQEIQNIDTSYKPTKILETSNVTIQEFRTSQISINWNKEARSIIETFNTQHIYEPNLDYTESKVMSETIHSNGDAVDVIHIGNTDPEIIIEDEIQNSKNSAIFEDVGKYREVKSKTQSLSLDKSFRDEEAAGTFEPNLHNLRFQVGQMDNVDQLADELPPGEYELEQNWLMHYLDVENTVFINRKTEILTKIREITLSLLECAANGKPLKLKFKNNKKWANCTMEEGVLKMRSTTTDMKTVNFMAKSSERKFAVMVHIIGEVFKLLSTNSTCTKREIYYRDVEFLQSQNNVDRCLNDVCLLLEAKPWELGIISTSKGLITGDLKILYNDRILRFGNGGQVPSNVSGITNLETNATHILVVEKDAVYQSLLDGGIIEKFQGQLILITAKGYPDVNTRLLLKKLFDKFGITIYVMVDADPHGIEIMFNYRFGSLSMSYLADSLAVPSVRWIGIYPSEIETLSIPKVRLTKAEIKKLREMIARKYIDEFLKYELEMMLKSKFKAEIEGISDISLTFFINDYIPGKIRRNAYELV